MGTPSQNRRASVSKDESTEIAGSSPVQFIRPLLGRFSAIPRKSGICFGAVLLISALFLTTSTLAQTNLFFDDFNGPAMKSDWVATGLPTFFPPVSYPPEVTYLGAPATQFEAVDGASVLHMSDTLNNLQRVGWTVATTFSVSNFRYEVRFNTLTQSASTSIDGFIELWILDAANSNRFDIFGLFGSSYSTSLRYFLGSTIDNVYRNPIFNYQNDTWYRLVISGSLGADLSASLCDDTGAVLINGVFGHDTGAFPSGFKIGLSEGMGTPNAAYPQEVAVDYAVLSTASPSGPLLTAVASTNGLTLGWPVSVHFILQSTPNLAPPIQWVPVTNPVQALNGTNSTTVALDQAAQFFRLMQQQP
jgi:hypothetical protein